MTAKNPQTDSAALAGRVEAILNQMTLEEKTSLLSGVDTWHTFAIERLGVPEITMTDGPHGVRADRADPGRMVGATTAFPTGIALASTWNPELVRQAAAALGEETAAMGCDMLLGPCVNIVRHPLAGRNFEAYSEDPCVAGEIGTAWVQGVQSVGVGASLKHFACNNQETERMRGNSVVDERTLREIYLPHFEKVVKEANPWTVMCAYNRVNGAYASQNRRLLTEILRDEWGFEGAVISDWGAVHNIYEPVAAGLDLEMPGPAHYFGMALEQAVRNWQIEESAVDTAARRILKLVLTASAARKTAKVNTREHQELARKVAEESITLLKNDGDLLPLDAATVKRLAVIGANAADLQVGGGGSSKTKSPYKVNPLDAIRRRAGDGVQVDFAPGCDNYDGLLRIGAENLRTPNGDQSGLLAEYFAGPGCQGSPAGTEIVHNLDFFWYNAGPVPAAGSRRYSARFSGRLVVPESGSYLLRVDSGDVVSMTVDGVCVSNEAGRMVELQLEAGRAYNVCFEFSKDNPRIMAFIRMSMTRNYRPGEDRRLEKAVELARSADVALVFAGYPEDFESEGGDRADMHLTGGQDALIAAVAAANPNTVVVLNCGVPVSMPWVDSVRALVTMYYPGMEGGNAIASVLFGDVNPSGKLTVTYPKRLEDTPAWGNFPGARDVLYGEGIFVGYRWYDVRGIEPLFPFGHGLSYTTFEYSDLAAQPAPDGTAMVSLTVRNTGKRAGQEVVLLYVRDVECRLARPAKELKAFRKVALQPGQAQRVEFTLSRRDFSFYDPALQAWVLEPGAFEVMAGGKSCQFTVK